MNFCALCINHIAFVFILFDQSLALCVSVCVCVYTCTHTHIYTLSCSIVSNLCAPFDCSWPGSSVHGIFQARILESVAISFSREFSQPRDGTCVSCVGRWVLYHCATWEAQCIYICVYIYVFHCNSHYWLSTWINMSASSKLTLISIGNDWWVKALDIIYGV